MGRHCRLHLVEQFRQCRRRNWPVGQRRLYAPMEFLGGERLQASASLAHQKHRKAPLISGETMPALPTGPAPANSCPLIGGTTVDDAGVLDSTHRTAHCRRVPAGGDHAAGKSNTWPCCIELVVMPFNS